MPRPLFALREQHLSAFRAALRSEMPGRIEQTLREKGVAVELRPGTREIVIADGRGHQSRLLLAPSGLPEKLVSPLGATTTFTFDGADRVACVDLPGGERVRFSYDPRGFVQSVRRDPSAEYQFERDTSGRLLMVMYPDQTRTSLSYGIDGELQAVADRCGATTRFDQGMGGDTITDPLGRCTRFQMDTFCRLESIVYPDDTRDEFSVDPESNTLFVNTRDGRWIQHHLDDEGRPRAIHWSDGGKTEMQWDKQDRLVKGTNATDEVERTFNDRGDVQVESSLSGKVEYEYDEDGRLVGLTTPFGECLQFRYDEDGRLESVRDWGGAETLFHYQVDGALESIRYGNGAVEFHNYSVNGRLTSARLSTLAGSVRSSQEYQYDDCDRLVWVTDVWGNDSEQRLARQLKYDPEQRLVAEIDAETQRPLAALAYDVKGNMIRHDAVPISVGLMDQPVRWGDEPIEYDGGGNITRLPGEKGVIACRFSAENRLREATVGGRLVRFEYDALGRRVAKVCGPERWRYGWAGHQLLWEQYQSGPDREPVRRDYLFLPGSVVPLAFREQGRTYWMQTDVRGAVICVLDDQGETVWRATYDAFGQARLHRNGIRQPWRLAGHYHDEETGLHYNFARYYSPLIRSYLSMDPNWTDFEATNYGYARNDPWNRADTLGMVAPLVIAAGVGAVVGGVMGAVMAPEGRKLGAALGGAAAGAIAGMGAIYVAAAATKATALGIAGGVGLTSGATDALVQEVLQPTPTCWPCVAKSAGLSGLLDVLTLGIASKFPGIKSSILGVKAGKAPKAGAKLTHAPGNLGKLRSVGKNTWETSSGLRYGPDLNPNTTFTNRVQHVLHHASDVPTRPGKHGVFDAGRFGALGVVDEAWIRVRNVTPGVISTTTTTPWGATRTTYMVPMGRRVGYVGGVEGAAAGNPAASFLRIVVDNGNNVVSAFPAMP